MLPLGSESVISRRASGAILGTRCPAITVPPPRPSRRLSVAAARPALWATAAPLGVSGAATAAVGMVAGFLVYQYTRARGQWGTDEPPDGMAEEVTFSSAEDAFRISGWFFAAPATRPGPAIVLCHG